MLSDGAMPTERGRPPQLRPCQIGDGCGPNPTRSAAYLLSLVTVTSSAGIAESAGQ